MNNKINLLLKWPKVSLMLFWIFLLGCSPYAHRENSSSEENSDRLESLLLSVPARFFQDNEIYEKDLTFRDVGGYGFFEGDIVLGKTNKLTQTTLNFILPSSQTGMILPEDLDVIRPFGYASQGGRLWTGGIVPYEFSQEVERAEAAVKQAMDQITQMTGIRFVKRTSETDYLRFVKSDVAGTCGSYVGRLGGEQEIFIQSGAQGCGLSSNVHELLHALGIYHEQSRSDRDQYVEILYDNIEKGFARQFDIMPGITLGQYDFRSVMHYGTTFFSKNGKPTIRSLNGEKIERTSPMSATDAEAIRTLYSGEMSGSRQCDMGSAGGPCPVFNGTGRMENQTCDTSSLQWVGGVCTVQSCNSGFKPDAANMSCVADAVENQVPVGNVDDLSNTGLLQGWAYDPDQPGTSIAIHYYIDGGFAGNNVADKIRTDINDKLKIPGNHGFQFTIPSQYRDGKSHTIGAYAIDLQGGTNPLVGTRSFLLGNSAVGQCDPSTKGGACPIANGAGRMENQTCDTSSLQWVGGVCTVQSCNSGFKPDAANMSCVADAVENQVPVGNVDDLSNTGLLQGWAYDPDQPGTSIAIHYYIDGGFAGNNVADKIRTDVNDKLKIPGNHGFQFTIPSQYRDGKAHTIGAYAIDLQGGANPLVGTRSFTLGTGGALLRPVSASYSTTGGRLKMTVLNAGPNGETKVENSFDWTRFLSSKWTQSGNDYYLDQPLSNYPSGTVYKIWFRNPDTNSETNIRVRIP